MLTDANSDRDNALATSEADRGRSANAPDEIPVKGLKDVVWRIFHSVIDERITLIAAGVAFFLILSLFPALGALVALYGFVADPSTIAEHIAFLSMVLPPGSFDIILGQLTSLIGQKNSTLSIAFASGLLVALWSANSGIKALFDAMNVAYHENEKRSLIRLNLQSLIFTVGGLAFTVILLSVIAALPAVLAYVSLDLWQETMARYARWPFVLVVTAGAISIIYRYGPSREKAKPRWISWGVIFSTTIWLAASIGFSFYLENFANYNVTYGTLGALIGFMVWSWISVLILVVGASLNAELEHQTTTDSTTGAPLPMGSRGAFVADTVGKASD